MAVDTLGHLLVVHVTPADEQERAQVQLLCKDVQQARGHTVQLAWADQGYTGDAAAEQQRIKELEREVRELRQTNEILKLASAYFAKAELDRHHKK